MRHPLKLHSHESRVARWMIRVNGTIENAYVKAFERAHGYQMGRDWGTRDRSLWRPFWRRVCLVLQQTYMIRSVGPKPKARRMRPINTRHQH